MARTKLKLVIGEAERAELEARYRRSRGAGGERERLRAIRLAVSGNYTYAEISEVVGRARSLIQLWVQRYQQEGLEGLLTRKKAPGKASPVADPQVQAALEEGLKAGRWRTAPQIAAWLREEYGIERAVTTIYYWLGKVGGALKVPRPVHQKKDTEASQRFTVEFSQRLSALDLPAHVPVKVWVMDEHRYGLQPVQRRVWGWPGHRLVTPVCPRFQWGYVYGALECVTGEAEFLYTDGVSQAATAQFYQQLQATAPEAWHVIVADQAGFHLPDGHACLPAQVRVVPLPPYSPELNPVEKLWDVLKDQVANQVFASLETLQTRLSRFLATYWTQPSQVLRLIGQGWLHTQANTLS